MFGENLFKRKYCLNALTLSLASFLLVFVQALSEELVVGGPRWVSQWATLAASHIRTDPEGSGGESHIMVTEDRGTWRNSSEQGRHTEFGRSAHL